MKRMLTTALIATIVFGCDEPGPRVKPSDTARLWASKIATVEGATCEEDEPGSYGTVCTVVFKNGGVAHVNCWGFASVNPSCLPFTGY